MLQSRVWDTMIHFVHIAYFMEAMYMYAVMDSLLHSELLQPRMNSRCPLVCLVALGNQSVVGRCTTSSTLLAQSMRKPLLVDPSAPVRQLHRTLTLLWVDMVIIHNVLKIWLLNLLLSYHDFPGGAPALYRSHSSENVRNTSVWVYRRWNVFTIHHGKSWKFVGHKWIEHMYYTCTFTCI